MSHRRTPWGLAVDAVLADGGWHYIDVVIAAAMAAVPPGPAYRRGEADRVKSRSGRGAPATRAEGDRATAIDSGARSLVRNSIESGVRRGRIERSGDVIRLRPKGAQ